MSNQQSPRFAADTMYPVSSSAVLDNLYAGRQRSARPENVTLRRAPQNLAPEAIWGQFNNYRSNGLVGSAIAHVIILGLILASALFGHQVVQKVEQHETVTLIAPSPDSYALPVAKKVVSGGGGGGDHDQIASAERADCPNGHATDHPSADRSS